MLTELPELLLKMDFQDLSSLYDVCADLVKEATLKKLNDSEELSHFDIKPLCKLLDKDINLIL